MNYHANGQVHQISHRNNVTVTQGMDPNFLSRPRSISTSGVGGGGNWLTGQYTFDGSGNVVWIGGSLYLYDEVSRVKSARVMLTPAGFSDPDPGGVNPDGLQLIFADGFESASTSAWTVPVGPTSASQEFSCDAFGNLLQVIGDPGISIPVNPAANKLTAVGPNPYDTAGNMTSWNGNSYSYGPFNETWRGVTSNQEWVHVYTADDERLLSYQVVGGVKAKKVVQDLCALFTLAPDDAAVIRRAIPLPVGDFEDAVTTPAAEASGCEAILTRDGSGFRGSPVPAIDPTLWLTLLREAGEDSPDSEVQEPPPGRPSRRRGPPRRARSASRA